MVGKMSKTVEWSISLRQKKGMIKMVGLITNMIQDHDIQEIHIITQQEWSLRDIHSQIVRLVKRGTYDIQDREFLNQVRNLVLEYQRLDKRKKEQMPWDDELTWAMNLNSMKLNSKGQIINRF